MGANRLAAYGCLGAAALFLLVAPLAVRASAQSESLPNIVLIIADDLGWPYFGFMGDPVVLTPNLDALASGGTVFTSTHSTASTCAPSLRGLLAGIHSVEWDRVREAQEVALGPIPNREDVV